MGGMIIALPINDDETLAPFGRAPNVAVVTVAGGEITDWQMHQTEWDVLHDVGDHGQHHARMVRFLADNGVQHVVFDHMGQPMQHVVSKMGIGLHQAGSLQAREAARQAAVALG